MRVLAAMSGGVDSAVAAALMMRAGHEVVGVTLQLYDQGAAAGRKGACCAGKDIGDARDAAAALGIPHYVIDREARFRQAVIEDFADAYAAGETPVPCIRCNQSVKFNDLLALAADLGCEAMATGHYARRIDGPSGPELHRAADPDRDQSYFLCMTTGKQLARSLFPLGEHPKAEVRRLAGAFGLALADKPDSQDLCFVPRGSYAGLVQRLRPDAMRPGEIVDRDGRALGGHAGVGGYTVGQGKRLGKAAQSDGARNVVLALDADAARVVVGPREAAGTRTVRLREVNWLAPMPTGPLPCLVKLRARDELRPATLHPDRDGGATVQLAEPALPAPGQACAFHADANENRVLGGGFIRAR